MFTEEMGIASLTYKSCAAITVQCLADSGITSWKAVFNQQIDKAKRLGQMPDYIKVIREVLKDFGFVMQSTQIENIRIWDLLNKLGQLGESSIIFIQVVDYKHCGGNMIALRTDGYKYSMINPALKTSDNLAGWTVHVWIRWDDGIDRSPFPRKSIRRSKGSSSRSKSYHETECYKPFQSNPCNNYIGDCVVRDVAGVMEIPWADAVDLLATAQETTVNAREVYPKVLEKNGYLHYKPMVRDGHRLEGKVFCDEMSRAFRKGERIFAHAGRSHAAAIVPISNDTEGTVYRIIDSWDSSKLTIGDYWVGPAKGKGSDKDASPNNHYDKPFSVGESLHHPSFGRGTIIAVTPGILTIDFGTSGIRRLEEAWVRVNCLDTTVNSGSCKDKWKKENRY